MIALNVKQPWAHWIATGAKTIETRTYPTRHRGPILIVASKKPDMSVPGLKAFKDGELEYGKAICIATLVGCRLMTEADEQFALCCRYPRAHSWVMKNIRKIKPFPVKGRLGMYHVDLPHGTLSVPDPDPGTPGGRVGGFATLDFD